MEELREKLNKKLENELKEHVDYLKSKGPDAIIEGAYGLVSMQEIKDYLYYTKLEPNEIKALLKHHRVLDDLYDEWLGADGNFYSQLEYIVDDRVKEIGKEFMEKMKKQDKGAR